MRAGVPWTLDTSATHVLAHVFPAEQEVGADVAGLCRSFVLEGGAHAR